RNARNALSKQATRTGYQLQPYFLAVTATQHVPHVAKPIDQTEIQTTHTGPEQAREDEWIISQLIATAHPHHIHEHLVNFDLQGLQIFNVAFLFRLERIKDSLVFTCGVNAPLDTDLF